MVEFHGQVSARRNCHSWLETDFWHWPKQSWGFVIGNFQNKMYIDGLTIGLYTHRILFCLFLILHWGKYGFTDGMQRDSEVLVSNAGRPSLQLGSVVQHTGLSFKTVVTKHWKVFEMTKFQLFFVCQFPNDTFMFCI